ncbi:hypothetical protein E2C01_024019 [Portunus trituberculatus]|uniref:Uncharacterized protein n=1 Tax=Portunus trituberculatus TaxID=210409 RepID=A0A5B7EBK8_PORTR|nr:hypothetical protein [Portunus trituberculatus]
MGRSWCQPTAYSLAARSGSRLGRDSSSAECHSTPLGHRGRKGGRPAPEGGSVDPPRAAYIYDYWFLWLAYTTLRRLATLPPARPLLTLTAAVATATATFRQRLQEQQTSGSSGVQ